MNHGDAAGPCGSSITSTQANIETVLAEVSETSTVRVSPNPTRGLVTLQLNEIAAS
jgi:hypothetical protein